MEVSKRDLLTRREDDHRYYVIILANNGTFRLIEPKTVNDVYTALAKFVQLGDEESWNPQDWIITYKRTILAPSVSLVSIPRGAILEAKKLKP